MTTRKTHTAAFKAQVVQQVLREDKTLAQIAAEHGIHPNQISQWKATARQGLPTIFERGESAQATVLSQAPHREHWSQNNVPWTAEEQALLGTVPNAQVAALLGRTLAVVRAYRKTQGILSLRDRQVIRQGPPVGKALLSRETHRYYGPHTRLENASITERN